jgi:hypothetical protein
VLVPESVDDVARSNGPEERPGRPGVDVEAQLDVAEPCREPLSVLERLRLVARAPLLEPAQLGDPRPRRLFREPSRQ